MQKEKQLVPQLRFPEFSVNWEIKNIKNIAKVVGGGTPSTTNNKYWNGDINWFTPTEIKFDIVSESLRKISDLGLQKSSATLLPKDTILLTTRATIGEVAIAQEECTTNQGFQSLVVNKNNSNQFVFDLIKVYRKQLYKRANGSTFKEVSKKEIEKIEVLIPSLPEQQKIANFLTAVDNRIQTLEKKKALLEQYKKGIMQQIFKQQLRFKDENGNAFPEWKNKKLGEVLDYEQPTKYIVKSVEYDNSYKTPVLTAGKTFILGYTDEKNNLFTNTPVIIFDDFTMANQYVDFDFKVKSSAMKILKNNSNISNLGFVYSAIQVIKYPKGDEHKRFWISEYSKIKIPFPCLEEQTKIANFLSSINKNIGLVNTKIEHTKSYKKGLLQQMFV